MADKPRIVYRRMFEYAPPKWGFVFGGSRFWGYDSLAEAMYVLMYVMRPEGVKQ